MKGAMSLLLESVDISKLKEITVSLVDKVDSYVDQTNAGTIIASLIMLNSEILDRYGKKGLEAEAQVKSAFICALAEMLSIPSSVIEALADETD